MSVDNINKNIEISVSKLSKKDVFTFLPIMLSVSLNFMDRSIVNTALANRCGGSATRRPRNQNVVRVDTLHALVFCLRWLGVHARYRPEDISLTLLCWQSLLGTTRNKYCEFR